jgi:hypothetical protein
MNDDLVPQHTPAISQETRNRILVAVYAYAYEVLAQPLVSDEEFDQLASKINIGNDTGRPDLDQWFRDNFEPYTGSWIHKHPELDGIIRIYEAITTRGKS